MFIFANFTLALFMLNDKKLGTFVQDIDRVLTPDVANGYTASVQ
jgi:hypothetical protein